MGRMLSAVPRMHGRKCRTDSKSRPILFGLKEPRQIRIAPNGDIFLAESGAGRIRVIRPVAGAPTANNSAVFVSGFDDRPYGIAFYPLKPAPQYVYIATQTKIMRYPYRNGDLTVRGPAQIIVPDLPEGGHWTRDIQFTPDGKTMLVSVGSDSNDAEGGLENEKTARIYLLSIPTAAIRASMPRACAIRLRSVFTPAPAIYGPRLTSATGSATICRPII